jgi:predicted HTH domain antitoxin
VPREKLVLPDELAALLGPEPSQELLARAAATLYAQGKISFGAGARLAGVPYVEFFAVLARYGITLNYTAEDLAEDLRTLEELCGRRGPGA